MKSLPQKIVIIGPESTGKSTLCEQLADHYHTLWCREYAREYLLEHGPSYSYSDLLEIAKGQIALEEKTATAVMNQHHNSPQQHPPVVFIDTDLYVMKVWCEFVFNQCHSWIMNQIASRHYDLYLLCNIDLPWVNDELREYPDIETRRKIYKMYKDLMINQRTPWVEISGDHGQRFYTARKAVKAHLKSGN